MKRFSRLLAVLLVVCTVAGLSVTTLASNSKVSKDLYYRDIKINLNGEMITPTDVAGNSVEPFIIDGTTYLPVRAVSNALGLTVGWDNATSTVSLSGGAGLSPNAIYERCKNSVVHIETPFGGGTGFFIEKDVIVTNNHVIENAYSATAKTVDGKVMTVTHVLAKSENPDLALLKVDGTGVPVKIASSIAQVGDNIYSIGAPLGIFPTFSSGMVLHNAFEENGTGFYLCNAGTLSGNSGGPVFNAAGEVVAVVQGGIGDGNNSMDLYIKIAHVAEMDRRNPIELTGKEPLPEDSMTKASSLSSAKVGELVTFGKYEQDNDLASKEEILWIVVEKNGSTLKLMSLYALDVIPFMDSDAPVTWEGSYARKFLNGEFLNNAFSSAEKAKIKTVTVSNPANPVHGTSSGPDTTDKVYLPSLEEVMDFYGITEPVETWYDGVFAHATPYAVDKNVWLEIPGSTKCWWWLRSAGGSANNATEVGSAGYLSFNGADADNTVRGVRPVINVDITK